MALSCRIAGEESPQNKRYGITHFLAFSLEIVRVNSQVLCYISGAFGPKSSFPNAYP